MTNLSTTMPLAGLPIRFERLASGAYLSACYIFRVRFTISSGGRRSQSSARQWRTIHVPTGVTIGHAASLHIATRTLNLLIGRWLCEGFAVLATMNLEAEHAAKETTAAQTARADLVLRILGVIQRLPHPIERLEQIAHDVADAIQPRREDTK